MLTKQLQARELAARTRKSLAVFVLRRGVGSNSDTRGPKCPGEQPGVATICVALLANSSAGVGPALRSNIELAMASVLMTRESGEGSKDSRWLGTLLEVGAHVCPGYRAVGRDHKGGRQR